MNDTPEQPQENPTALLDLVGRHLVRKSRPLSFDPVVEAVFQTDTATERNRQTIVAGLFALVFFNGFIIIDAITRPEILGMSVLVRLCIVTPLCLAALFWLRRAPPQWIRDSVLTCCAILIAVGSNYLLHIATSTEAHYSAFSFGLIVIGANIVLHIGFNAALATTIGCCVVTAFFLHATPDLNWSERNLPVYYMAAMGVITLVANYRLEGNLRHAYLLMLRERLNAQEVRRINEQLNAYSYTDALTGIANRRRFEQFLQVAWTEALVSGETMSLLVIDVDFFKRYNDSFGHPAGDACLQQVARAIEGQTRGDNDLPARLGGEEFAVLLRHTETIQATSAASRIHRAMSQLGLSHGRPDGNGHVTVSIGLASATPRHDGSSAGELVEAADKALYQAKRRGRNRTILADRAA
ncbi:diguanylate cyclase [Rhizobiales bacterium RZME27]|uniref:diguanylate cyclase n=1 Tax=Endobacterium cereale TaxID=2663029 RepID=A0A6A8A9D8_9HYPH|nr:GGDEF domain-containing protein [Endobacterium cereale]MEB2843356.1 GGDEF domain-containing protein [Endobacterium cereale]MQY47314.1 diguanylate cyclase [Endobacterium cereale]